MKRTLFVLMSAAAVVATMGSVPAVAANYTDQAERAPVRHTVIIRHRAIPMRERSALMSRRIANPRDVNANLNLSNANASANRPTESLATQLGATVTKSGNASDPICKPGDLVPMPDGQTHYCQ